LFGEQENLAPIDNNTSALLPAMDPRHQSREMSNDGNQEVDRQAQIRMANEYIKSMRT